VDSVLAEVRGKQLIPQQRQALVDRVSGVVDLQPGVRYVSVRVPAGDRSILGGENEKRRLIRLQCESGGAVEHDAGRRGRTAAGRRRDGNDQRGPGRHGGLSSNLSGLSVWLVER